MKSRKFIDIIDANEISIMFNDNEIKSMYLMPGEALRFLAFKKQNPGKIYIFEYDNISRVNLSCIKAYSFGGWVKENDDVLNEDDINYLRNSK